VNISASVDEMLVALRATVEYLKSQGSSQVNLKNGSLISVTGDVYLYEFHLDFLQLINTDADIEVRAGSNSAAGKVVAINENTITVQVDNNLGENLSNARLIISSYYLLEMLCQRLEGIKTGSIPASDLAMKTFGFTASETLSNSTYKTPSSQHGLNLSQEKALRQALGSEVTYIWGPPGTGKSQTIATIVEAMVKMGKSVLVLAHTNSATDSVMLKTVEHLITSDELRDGKFVREGTTSPELAAFNVIPEVIMEQRGSDIRIELAKLEEDAARINSILNRHNIAKKHFEAISQKLEKERQLMGYVKDCQSKYRINKTHLLQLEVYLERLNRQIEAYQNKNTFSKFFSGNNLERFSAQKAEQAQKIAALNRQNIQLKASANEAMLKSKLVSNNDGHVSAEKYEQDKLSVEQLTEYKKSLARIGSEKSALQKVIDNLADQLIAEAVVVATTLTKAYTSSRIMSRTYDCVILDEASIAPQPAIFCAAGLALKHMVLVGDFYQLPPINTYAVLLGKKGVEEAAEETKLVKKWLEKDIFHAVGIEDAISKGIEPVWLTQLDTQYRMHPDISRIVNKLIYRKFSLKDDSSVINIGDERVLERPLSGAHVGVYNTASLGSLPQHPESGGMYNVPHALLAVALAKEAIKNGYDTIGIISAYRKQITLIQKMLTADLTMAEQKKVSADTVHRFQGGQKQVIIFDVTTPASPSMYDDGREGGNDMKLLNVAFSRAEEKCILLADVPKIMKLHSATSLMREFIQDCEDTGKPSIDGKSILEHYSYDERIEIWLDKMVSTNGVNLPNSDIANAYDFYPKFLQDIIKAKQELIIVSAFITTRRMDQLRPHLAQLIKKGVRIFVITRTASGTTQNMRANALKELPRLEEMGIIVLPVSANTHEKLATVDREILWEGSLNILSQSDSSEIMFRSSLPGAATQVLNYLKLEKQIGPLGGNALKHCEICTEPGAWYWTGKSRYGGMWQFCLAGMHAPGKTPKTVEERNARAVMKQEIKRKAFKTSAGTPICPEHNEEMNPAVGRYGDYFKCINAPKCALTFSAKQAEKLGVMA
jgi:hypothetical protein